MLQQGQDVHQDAAAQEGRHESAPGPVARQHVVYEDPKRCGNHQGEQCQHEGAGDHSREHSPRSGKQGPQLLEQTRALAAGTEAGAGFESQGDPTETLAELFSGELAPARGRIVHIETAAVESFEDKKMAELPEQDQG